MVSKLDSGFCVQFLNFRPLQLNSMPSDSRRKQDEFISDYLQNNTSQNCNVHSHSLLVLTLCTDDDTNSDNIKVPVTMMILTLTTTGNSWSHRLTLTFVKRAKKYNKNRPRNLLKINKVSPHCEQDRVMRVISSGFHSTEVYIIFI